MTAANDNGAAAPHALAGWALIAHPLVHWLLAAEPPVFAAATAYIEGKGDERIEVAGPPSIEEMGRAERDRGRPVILPTITLQMTKMRSGDKRALNIDVSAADLAMLNDWKWRGAILSRRTGPRPMSELDA